MIWRSCVRSSTLIDRKWYAQYLQLCIDETLDLTRSSCLFFSWTYGWLETSWSMCLWIISWVWNLCFILFVFFVSIIGVFGLVSLICKYGVSTLGLRHIVFKLLYNSFTSLNDYDRPPIIHLYSRRRKKT